MIRLFLIIRNVDNLIVFFRALIFFHGIKEQDEIKIKKNSENRILFSM